MFSITPDLNELWFPQKCQIFQLQALILSVLQCLCVIKDGLIKINSAVSCAMAALGAADETSQETSGSETPERQAESLGQPSIREKQEDIDWCHFLGHM